jgi:hypothetical protein
MLHVECMEARSRLHAYLMARARYEKIISSPLIEITDREAAMARDWLTVVRMDYWQHIQKHGCQLERREDGNGDR